MAKKKASKVPVKSLGVAPSAKGEVQTKKAQKQWAPSAEDLYEYAMNTPECYYMLSVSSNSEAQQVAVAIIDHYNKAVKGNPDRLFHGDEMELADLIWQEKDTHHARQAAESAAPFSTEPVETEEKSEGFEPKVETKGEKVEKHDMAEASGKETIPEPKHSAKQVLVANAIDGDTPYQISDRLIAVQQRMQGRQAQDKRDHAERQASAWEAGHKAAGDGQKLGQAKVAYQKIDMGFMREFEEGFSTRTAELVRECRTAQHMKVQVQHGAMVLELEDGETWVYPMELGEPEVGKPCMYVENHSPVRDFAADPNAWIARLSAPGYLDSTSWHGPYVTEEQAKLDMEALYGAEDGHEGKQAQGGEGHAHDWQRAEYASPGSDAEVKTLENGVALAVEPAYLMPGKWAWSVFYPSNSGDEPDYDGYAATKESAKSQAEQAAAAGKKAQAEDADKKYDELRAKRKSGDPELAGKSDSELAEMAGLIHFDMVDFLDKKRKGGIVTLAAALKEAQVSGNDTPGSRHPDMPGTRPLAGEPVDGTGMPDIHGKQHHEIEADINSDPGKWKKVWDSLVGDAKHKHTKCFEKLKKHMTDEQAHGLCNKLKQKYGSAREAQQLKYFRFKLPNGNVVAIEATDKFEAEARAKKHLKEDNQKLEYLGEDHEASMEHMAWGDKGMPAKTPEDHALINEGKGEHVPLENGDAQRIMGKIQAMVEKEAVDQATKDYFSSYFGGYGKELTRDLGKKTKKKAQSSEVLSHEEYNTLLGDLNLIQKGFNQAYDHLIAYRHKYKEAGDTERMNAIDAMLDEVSKHRDAAAIAGVFNKQASKQALNEFAAPPEGNEIFGDTTEEKPLPPATRNTVMWVTDGAQHGDRQEVVVNWDKSLAECCDEGRLKQLLKTFVQQLGVQMEKNWGIVADIQVILLDEKKHEAVVTFKTSYPSPFVPEQRNTELRDPKNGDERKPMESHDYKPGRAEMDEAAANKPEKGKKKE